MNRKTFLVTLMLGALLHLMAISVAAQNRELLADIPFNFTVCKQQMPAGKYRVRPITSSTSSLLLVRSTDGQSVEIACTHDVQTPRPSEGKLIFHRYGNQYFLAELWFPGEMSGNQVWKSDREEAVIRELGPKSKRGKVTIRVTEARPN